MDVAPSYNNFQSKLGLFASNMTSVFTITCQMSGDFQALETEQLFHRAAEPSVFFLLFELVKLPLCLISKV